MEILRTKWAATVAGIWIQCVVGASYTFGIYSSVLKTTQAYDQSTLDTVSVFKDIGSNAGILSGLLYSYVTARPSGGGPWVVYAVGAVQCFVGYFMMWASVVGVIPPLPVPAMCLFMWLAAHAQTFFNTANVVTGVHNFGDYGGTIVGIMKGFLGLSGAILIQLYNVVCKDSPSTFLLLLAITPTLTSLLLMLLVRNYDTISPADKHHLNSFSAFALSIAAYLAALILLDNVLTLPYWARTLSFLILLFILITSPLTTALKAHLHESDILARALLEESGAKKQPLINDIVEADNNGNNDIINDGDDDHHHDVNMVEALCRLDFWLLFLAVFCGLGSGVATINNISQVGESLGYTTVATNSLVSLWSIWNFLGRFGAGYMSDSLLYKGGWARPLLMAVTLATMAMGHIVIASGLPACLYVGSVLVGVSYGSQWSLMPTICSEIFGVAHMGTIFNTIAVASPLGSYVFSVRVIGYLYDRQVAGNNKDEDAGECVGTRCFMMSFLIMASMAFFGSLVAVGLFFRTRRFYRVVVLRRLKRMQLS